MREMSVYVATVGAVSIAACLHSARADDTDAMIKSAMSAAPASVAKGATIVTFDDTMKMIVLRKGTNGFTCMPDNPATPGNDPECDDEAGM